MTRRLGHLNVAGGPGMLRTILSAGTWAFALGAALPARGAAQTSRTALASGTIAITDVAVIPMTSDTVLRGSTVVVRDGRIAEVGPSTRVAIPGGARRIDGRGRYLIPGLADMHAHLYSDGQAPDSVAPDELAVMLANGVTTVRLMIGTPEHLALRREIIAGRLVGPQLWVASPQFAGRQYENGVVVATPEDARRQVAAVADAGYEFIKLTLDITPLVFDAIVDAARARGIPVVGHVDPQVGVARAIAAGQQIEHLDNYLEAVLADAAPMRESVSNYGVFRPQMWESLDHIDDAKVARIAGETARAGIWSAPTLFVFNTAFAKGQTDEEIRSRPDWHLMPSWWRAGYLRARERYWQTPASEARRMRYVQVRNALVKAIADSGGRLLASSDTPEWFQVYGWTLHRELGAFVEAGLTPYQALETATRNPAEFLKASRDFGTIERGKRADFILLSANPLDDIANTAKIEAVAIGGRWMDRVELDGMLARATARINGP